MENRDYQTAPGRRADGVPVVNILTPKLPQPTALSSASPQGNAETRVALTVVDVERGAMTKVEASQEG